MVCFDLEYEPWFGFAYILHICVKIKCPDYYCDIDFSAQPNIYVLY